MTVPTQINEYLNRTLPTQINPYLERLDVTAVNPFLRDRLELQSGYVLNGTYRLLDKIDVKAGEADLFLCTTDPENDIPEYVAKIYRRESGIKTDVLERLAHLQCENVCTVEEYGEWNGRPYTITPYYGENSYSGKTFTYEELRGQVIPALNKALKALHDAGILHKDLKPSNIMSKEDGTPVLIDFGISAVIEDGVTMLIDQTGLTPAYAAPETFRDIFLKESDYYSFGIILFELYTGHPPYAGLSERDLERLVSVQKLPLPADMPVPLKDLITGLTYSDISNRKNKLNPNRRWTFNEVETWLAGKKQMVPGSGTALMENMPYTFMGESYSDLSALIESMAVHWKEGKDELFLGRLTSYFEKTNDIYADICADAERKASKVSGRDDVIFFDTVYRLLPEAKRLYWKGQQWENLPALGRSIVKAGGKTEDAIYACAKDMLEQNILAKYIRMFDDDPQQELFKTLTQLSKLYLTAYDNNEDPDKYIYELGVLLSGQVVLNIDGQQFYTIEDLQAHMTDLYSQSYDKLLNFCTQLLDKKQNLIPQLEVWLLALGKAREMREWKIEFGLIKKEKRA